MEGTMKRIATILLVLATLSASTPALAQYYGPRMGPYGMYQSAPPRPLNQPPTMIPNPSPGLIYGNPYGGPRVPEMVPNYGAPGMPAVGGGLTPSVPQGGGGYEIPGYGN
jgi:hypothetical protein